MDGRNNFLNSMENFISSIDDDYLISMTNKGTVNRAKKDLNRAEKIEYKILDDKIKFKIDDIECSIYSDINTYKCSCPARSICKHIVMCYLYIMSNKSLFFNECYSLKDECFNSESSCSLENTHKYDVGFSKQVGKLIKEDITGKEKEFTNLKEFLIKDIKKTIGDRNLFTIIKRIEFGITYDIKESSLITVDFKDENIVVKLLDNMENSVCSCKEKGMCRHKAEALILYKLKKGYLTFEELKSYDKSFSAINKEDAEKACREIKNVIEEILINGLSRLSSDILDKLNNTAIMCHNYDFPRFEKNLRDIREEINLYFKKDASFIPIRLLNKITKLYVNAIKVEKTDDIEKIAYIIGEFKTLYYDIPVVQLYGIGAEIWESKSGYEGITYYFYENNKKQFFTFTKSSPVFYDNYNSRNYLSRNTQAPWNINCTSEQLSYCHFKLIYGKINYKGRISSSSESHGFKIDDTDIRNLNIKEYTFNQWKDLIEVFEKDNLRDERYNLVFLKGKSFGKSEFDSINQIFRAEICDIDNRTIEISIPFSLRTKNIIRTLEKIVNKKELPMFFGRIYLSNGKIMFYPISYYDDGKPYSLI